MEKNIIKSWSAYHAIESCAMHLLETNQVKPDSSVPHDFSRHEIQSFLRFSEIGEDETTLIIDVSDYNYREYMPLHFTINSDTLLTCYHNNVGERDVTLDMLQSTVEDWEFIRNAVLRALQLPSLRALLANDESTGEWDKIYIKYLPISSLFALTFDTPQGMETVNVSEQAFSLAVRFGGDPDITP